MSDSIASAGADRPAQAPARPDWAPGDLLLAGASVVLAIALFLPWFSASVRLHGGFGAGGGFAPLGLHGTLHGTADGPRVHGYLWIVLVLVLTTLAILVLRPYLATLTVSLPSPRQLLLATTGLALLLTLIGFASRPAVPRAPSGSRSRSAGAMAPSSPSSPPRSRSRRPSCSRRPGCACPLARTTDDGGSGGFQRAGDLV